MANYINPVPYLEQRIDELELRLASIEEWAANHDYMNWVNNMGEDL